MWLGNKNEKIEMKKIKLPTRFFPRLEVVIPCLEKFEKTYYYPI